MCLPPQEARDTNHEELWRARPAEPNAAPFSNEVRRTDGNGIGIYTVMKKACKTWPAVTKLQTQHARNSAQDERCLVVDHNKINNSRFGLLYNISHPAKLHVSLYHNIIISLHIIHLSIQTSHHGIHYHYCYYCYDSYDRQHHHHKHDDNHSPTRPTIRH